MQKPIRKRNPHRLSDRFYDYLVAHKGEVLRYVIAALVTSLLSYLGARLFVSVEMLDFTVFLVRFPILFILLKYWVYKEFGAPIFRVARQIMIAIMAISIVTWILLQAIALLGGLVSGWMGFVVIYLLRFLIEVAYFLIYQFFIFKND